MVSPPPGDGLAKSSRRLVRTVLNETFERAHTSFRTLRERTVIVAIGLIALSLDLGTGAAFASGSADPPVHLLDCASGRESSVPLGETPLRISVNTDQPRLLEVAEQGQDVVLTSSSETQLRWVSVPPRLGTALLWMADGEILNVARLRPGSARGEVSLRVHCDSEEAARFWTWLQTADEIGRAFNGGAGSLSFDHVETLLASLRREAFDDRTRAWAIHLQAQAHFLAGHAVDAASTFLRAADTWDALGLTPMAAAARVGAAEDQNRAGKMPEAIAITRARPNSPDGSHYFGVRLENARCLALHYSGDLQGAAECYAWTTARFEVLGETLELAVTALDFAAVERSLERFEDAGRLALQSLQLATGPQSSPVQGRAHFFLADLAIRRGDIAEALVRLRKAGERFASTKEIRWQASMLMHHASLLTHLGAYGDARIAAEHGLLLLDRRHAAARVANAEVVLARIDLAEGNFEDGLRRSKSALETYRQLAMPEELALAESNHARLLLAVGDQEEAIALLNGVERTTPHAQARLELGRAEALLALGRISEAKNALRSMRSDQLPLDGMLRLVRLHAWITWYQGDPAEAMNILRSRALVLHQLAGATRSSLLTHALMQRLSVLRQSAMEMIARAIASNDARFVVGASLLEWMALSTLPESRESVDPDEISLQARRIDQSIGRALLGSSSEQPGVSWEALLGLLDQGKSATTSLQSPIDAGEWQRRITSRGEVLALLPGEQLAVLAVIRNDDVTLYRIDDLAALRTELSTSLQEVQSPTGSTGFIDARARSLSRVLQQPFADQAQPERLRVIGAGMGADVPWALLYWPGESLPLAHRTALVLVEPTAQATADRRAVFEVIDILQAIKGVSGNENSILPPLLAARTEVQNIQTSIGNIPVRLHPAASREALLDTLGRPDAFIHISSHGALSPGLLAGSGLWLDSEDTSSPEYVSGIDIHERGAHAYLLVLNACQLADEDILEAGAAINFATALSQAGVHHVIAARWPVSDTASNLWVPAFYKALAATDPPDPAQALVEARRALRASRAFRHPFHWAGWVHLERVGFAPQSSTKH